jgi:hypothetical protein
VKLADDLRQLHQLLEDGILTQAEFDAQKQALLAQAQGTAPAVDTDTVEQSVADADAGSAISLAPKDAALTATAASFSRPTPTAKNTNQLPWPLIVGGIAVVALVIVVISKGNSQSGNGQAFIHLSQLPASSDLVFAIDLSDIAPVIEHVLQEMPLSEGMIDEKTMRQIREIHFGGLESLACSISIDSKGACSLIGELPDLDLVVAAFNNFVGGTTPTIVVSGEDNSLTGPEHNEATFSLIRKNENEVVIGTRDKALWLMEVNNPIKKRDTFSKLLSHLDQNGIFLMLSKRSDKSFGGLIQWGLSVSLSSEKLMIKAVAYPVDDETRNQLEMVSGAFEIGRAKALQRWRAMEEFHYEGGMERAWGQRVPEEVSPPREYLTLLQELTSSAQLENSGDSYMLTASVDVEEVTLKPLVEYLVHKQIQRKEYHPVQQIQMDGSK